MIRLNQRGETIVEVLIAIAVIGSVIGSAYAIASRSFNNTRQAQERSEALKFAQTQVEQIKALSTVPNNEFCIDAKGADKGSVKGPFTSFDENSLTSWDTGDAQECKDANFNRYRTITQNDDGTLKTIVKWDRFGENGVEELTMQYRVY